MGGGRHLCAVDRQLFHDGDGQRRALHRVGAGTQLVDEYQAVRIRLLDDRDDVGHVRREGGQALLNALLVADIHQHLFVDRDGTSLRHRQHQSTHRHQGHQAQRL